MRVAEVSQEFAAPFGPSSVGAPKDVVTVLDAAAMDAMFGG